MCPPAQTPPPADIGMYWSDEQIISSLNEYAPGSDLPNNVLADLSPFQCPPSNLPEGIWYLINTKEKKESVFGFWKEKGEACKIYSNSVIGGWRTTLEYFDGEPPHGQRTDWLMQVYTITQTDTLAYKDKLKESKSLCRVFLSCGCSSKCEEQPGKCKTVIESKKIDSLASLSPTTDIISDQDHRSELKGENDMERPLVVADGPPNSSQPELSELEYSCLLRGDYLELNDLLDHPESHSSSSQNSTCLSNLSDEYFDSLALLRDIEDDERYSFATSARPNDVVSQPLSPGALLSGTRSINTVEGSPTDSTINRTMTDKRVIEHPSKRHNPESRDEGTSNSYDTMTPSTSRKNASPNGEKKAGACRMKKLKMYFCFTP